MLNQKDTRELLGHRELEVIKEPLLKVLLELLDHRDLKVMKV